LLHAAEVAAYAGAADPPVDSLAVTVTQPPLFSLDTEEVYRTAHRGATFLEKITVNRQPGFEGEVVLTIADRQARYLQGATGPAVTVKPGEKKVVYPVFFPETMDMNRTARVLLMGTTTVKDAAGKAHYATQTTQKQIVARMGPSILTLTCDLALIEAARGRSVEVPLRLGRAPELAGPVAITAILAADMKGITATAIRLAGGDEAATLKLELAPDAQLGGHDRLLFRASGESDGYPVIAERAVEIELGE
jgi:hypothetical protein